jgi:hypothetical protein
MRDPNTRLAAQRFSAGNRRGKGGFGFQDSTPLAERLTTSVPYRLLFQAAVVVHCILAAFENEPSSTACPRFSWWPGIVEACVLCLYVFDLVVTFWAFGLLHFKDKKWDSTFAIVTVAAVLDWCLYYAGGGYLH